MSPFLNALLAMVFVACGMAATFVMLELRGAPRDRTVNTTLIRLHKLFGWIFAGLFLFLTGAMLIKTAGYQEEVSPRIALHITLALALVPLLLTKLLIVRRYHRFSRHLIFFGPAMMILAVSLSGLSAGHYFLHSSDIRYVSLTDYDETVLDKGLGRQVVYRKCNKCHTLERVFRSVKSRKEWTDTVNRMARLGAPNISSFDVKQTIFFLLGRQKETTGQNEQALNRAIGKTILESKCGVCHELDRIVQARKDKAGWQGTINRMIDHSGDAQYLSDTEKQDLIDYLIHK
jgi:cytochrome c2